MEGGTVALFLTNAHPVKGWVLLVLAVVLVLLLLVVLQLGGYIALKKTAERFTGLTDVTAYPGHGLNSGYHPNVRTNSGFQTDMTQPGQGIGYNTSLTTAIVGGPGKERLVSVNTAPDFWTVTDVLGEAQEQDRTGRGGLAENQYWSPDLQQWLTSAEVAMLPEDQKKRVQFYGGVGQNPSMVTNAAAPAAAAEHMRGGISNYNKTLEGLRGRVVGTPEDVMMSEMFSATGVDQALMTKAF